MAQEDRIRRLKEAMAIEAAGGQWNAHHVAALLGIARKTVYDVAWLRRISKPSGNGRHSWIPAEVRSQQQLEAKRRPIALRRARGR